MTAHTEANVVLMAIQVTFCSHIYGDNSPHIATNL
jgi:hypothetical protein